MDRINKLHTIIAVLLLLVIALGIYVYREETKPEGVQINIGERGITVEEN